MNLFSLKNTPIGVRMYYLLSNSTHIIAQSVAKGETLKFGLRYDVS